MSGACLDPEKLAKWADGTWQGTPGPITGVSIDSRTVRPGDLFFALCGENTDGHVHLPAALAAGAAGAVAVAGKYEKPTHGAVLEVADTAQGLWRMAQGHRSAVKALVVGVTGSVGKTTVKEMVAGVLAAEAHVARTPGNWNNELGLPLSLLGMPVGTRAGVFEVGMSHPGELKSLCELLLPDWGVITRIGPVHIEFFDSVEAIAREKGTLLRALPANGLAFLNADDPFFPILREASRARVVSVSSKQSADYRAAIPEDGGVLDVEERSGLRYRVTVPLPGRHNAQNALLALAVGRERGLSPESIQASLQGVRPPPMRWDVSDVAGVQVVNDAYNANPLSMRAALRAFAAAYAPEQSWLALGGMRELGHIARVEHEELGREIGAGAWAGLIAIGALAEGIAAGAIKAGMQAERIAICPDHESAASELAARVRPGNAALFKASRGERLELALDLWRKKVCNPETV